MRRIDDIVVHCSATPVGMDIGRYEIDTMHKAKGWHGIGYHAVIRRNGQLEDGRPLADVGAHVKGHNEHSIGICMVGGVDDDNKPDFNYTRAQLATLDGLLASLLDEFPDASVKGHRDYADVHKACPCFNVGAWYGKAVIG